MELREKYVTIALIVFIAYLCTLIALFLLSGIDIITDMQDNEITINPLFTELAVAGLIILALPLIAIEVQSKIRTPLERKIVFYLSLFFATTWFEFFIAIFSFNIIPAKIRSEHYLWYTPISSFFR